ncbi:EAL domain-containing protein [Halopseudomonas nanhaiensis]|uniref:EAL domain-containing protein n=1 Tax=Halopseudomonas nanhaiensis TaxID=2830842 RepID=UPI001CBB045C|nr:EAL domain-containing protein [Halopseudomonas nanhaiensis]UAW99068.1 EAL domain-containing protein [Halopseudomonas nanhaiensis]
MPNDTASGSNRPPPDDRRPLAIGLTLVAIAGTLLAWLMVWQAWQDYRVLRNQHQVQVEESVWAMAEQLGVNLTLKSTAAEHILHQTRSAEGGMPASLQELIPGLIEVRHVTPDSQLIDQPLAPWMPMLRRLSLTNQPYAIEFDPTQRLVYWLIGGRDPGEFWVMLVREEAISAMLWSHPASGFSWLIEDAGQVRVLARQESGELIYVDEPALNAEERERVAVSAPVEGTLWQVRGLIDEGYYESRLGRLIITKAVIVAAFVAVLLLAVWLVARMQYANRRLAYRSQRSREGLVEAERRYRDIFQSVGMALCQLNLADLREHLDRLGLRSAADLDAWLEAVDSHSELLQHIRVVDANRNTLELLGLDSVPQMEVILQADEPIRKGGARYALMLALIDRQERLELETPMRTARGALRYVWMVMRLPEDLADYSAVTMSISDITARRQVELTMIERERFWSGVVKAVPDIVFIKDMQRNQFVFSNRSLAQALGYTEEEESGFGPSYRDEMVHPDDLEYVLVNRNLQQVLPDGKLLDWRNRWRHKDGSWHWFNVRMKVLSRLPDGRAHQLIGIVKDVHQQTLMTERLKTGEQRYRLLAENISDVIWATDEAFELNYVSPSVKRALGYEPEFLITHGFVEVVAGTRFNRFMGAMLRELQPRISNPESAALLWREGFHRQTTFDCIKADGHTIPVELRVSLMWDPSGRFLGMLGIARDISEQRRTENRLRMAATVFENTTGAIFVTDPAGYIVQVNENFSQITGYDSVEVIDQTPQVFASGVHEEHFYRNVLTEMQREGRWEGEVWQKRKNGEIFPSWAGITAVQDSDGDLVSYVCFFVDISERKASEARIESLAYYDALTGLPNRALFQERLSSALKVAGRRNEWIAVLFLDLDRFKPINDTMGHAAGDVMLKEVGQRLQTCIRESDTVARMGGDEFTMLLAGLTSRESAMRAGISVAEKILEQLAPAFILQEREFFISASIGIALSPQDGTEGSQLLQNADTAMYHAKSAGKDTFQFYQAEMNARALERLSLENDLRKAVHDDAFTLHFQPQFGCVSGELTGVEALLRWQHPTLGAISPAVFIPVAEEIGLVSALGDWVLDRACRQMAEWHAAGHPQPRMAINLSGRQFAEGRLAEQVARVIRRYDLHPSCIELELTESILLRDVEETMQTLAQLKELGVHIAVDDFGTGYSSLNYLKDFPIDTLKIDRSFIQAMHAGSRDARLAEAIIAMGRSLQLMVIAEGVETAEQHELLRSFGCDEVQGFYLGKPMSAEDLRDRHLSPA